jgi:hypothetical protein
MQTCSTVRSVWAQGSKLMLICSTYNNYVFLIFIFVQFSIFMFLETVMPQSAYKQIYNLKLNTQKHPKTPPQLSIPNASV